MGNMEIPEGFFESDPLPLRTTKSGGIERNNITGKYEVVPNQPVDLLSAASLSQSAAVKLALSSQSWDEVSATQRVEEIVEVHLLALTARDKVLGIKNIPFGPKQVEELLDRAEEEPGSFTPEEIEGIRGNFRRNDQLARMRAVELDRYSNDYFALSNALSNLIGKFGEVPAFKSKLLETLKKSTVVESQRLILSAHAAAEVISEELLIYCMELIELQGIKTSEDGDTFPSEVLDIVELANASDLEMFREPLIRLGQVIRCNSFEYYDLIKVLGRVGELDPQRMIVALKPYLLSSNQTSAKVAMGAIAKLGQRASSVVPDLLRLVDHPDLGISAIRCLGDIGPAASSAAEKIFFLLDEEKLSQGIDDLENLEGVAIVALAKIGKPKEALEKKIQEFWLAAQEQTGELEANTADGGLAIALLRAKAGGIVRDNEWDEPTVDVEALIQSCAIFSTQSKIARRIFDEAFKHQSKVIRKIACQNIPELQFTRAKEYLEVVFSQWGLVISAFVGAAQLGEQGLALLKQWRERLGSNEENKRALLDLDLRIKHLEKKVARDS